MASSIPQSYLPRRPATGSSSTPPLSPVQVNSVRLKLVAHRLAVYLASGVRSEEISELCFILARGINYALSNNDVPSGVRQLPRLIKQVYEERKSSTPGSAILVLMISARNACRNGWFMDADANEILSMANEICSNYCTDASVDTGASEVTYTISKIITRYYPLLKLCRLIVSFEVKPGYNTLMGDFYVQRNVPPREKIVLFVAQTDNLETSSCIISPSQVSFLVNGKAVEKRSNISLDHGPKFPTDITQMVNCGTNIIQAIGYYTGHYIVAIAYMSKITPPSAPVLKDYVQPAVLRATTDSEIIEGSSRISLRCPISFKRIRKPVKGYLCKHHQCFDYDNFMEMNLRRPSWRCPHCNQPTSCIDLRLDQNLLQILNNVGEDVADVVINANGSWKSAISESRSADQSRSGTTMRQQADRMERESDQCSNNQTFVMDLTSEEDGEEGAAFNSRVAEHLNGVTDRVLRNSYGTEDRKSFENFRVLPGSASLAEASSNSRTSFTAQASNGPTASDTRPRISSSFSSNELSHEDSLLVASAWGTLESVVPNAVMNPVITDAVAPALTRDPTTVSIRDFRSTPPFEQEAQARWSPCYGLLQQPHLGNSVTNCQTERLPVTTHGQGVAVVSQALPAQSQTSSICQTTATDVFCFQSGTTCSGSSSISAQTFPAVTSMLEAINTQPTSRASDMFPSQPRLQSTIQLSGFPTQNLLGARAANAQQRGFGAYRAPLQPPSNILDLQNQMNNRCTNILPQSSYFPLLQQYTAARFAANLHASHIASLNASIVGHPTSGTVSTLPRDHHDCVTASSGQQFLNIGRGTPSMVAPQSSPAIQYEQNGQPTGRTRGGLTGSSFSAALAHCLAQPPRQVPARPSVSSLPFADQFLP